MTVPTELQTSFDAFRADRAYLGADHARNERRTWIVAAISLFTLVAQIAGGVLFKSMALVASGIHVAAHVASLTAAALAYVVARRYAADPRFAFGTGKVGYLVGFGNGMVLAVTAVLIAVESLQRIVSPEAIDYRGALPLAAAALAVNLVCVWLLRPAHAHPHDRDGDLNLSAAHLHLTADAAVAALTIAGLAGGAYLGWRWADAAAALVGAGLVGHFAAGLLRKAGSALLDVNPSPELTAEIRRRLEDAGATVCDLHLWRLGPGHHAAIAVVSAPDSPAVNQFHARLKGLDGLSHVTIEVRDHPVT